MTNVLLQRAMFNAGYTANSLAGKAGLSQVTVQRAVDGEPITAPTAKKIADTFDVKPTDLFTVEGRPAVESEVAAA